jgi:hypothetical protein
MYIGEVHVDICPNLSGMLRRQHGSRIVWSFKVPETVAAVFYLDHFIQNV